MLTGAPLPLPHNFPVRQLASLTQLKPDVGAWFRSSDRRLRLWIRADGRCSLVLIASDLGLLLRCCNWVILRKAAQTLMLPSELLISWRTLQVVTGTPYLPCPERLKELFPEVFIDGIRFHVPTQCRPPEEVLAECLTHGIPVAESRIIYREPVHSTRDTDVVRRDD